MSARLRIAVALALTVASHPAGAAASSAAIGTIVRAADPLLLDGEPLDGPQLRALYAPGGFEPLWTAERQDAAQAVLQDAAAEGLDPAHYHVAAITAHRGRADERGAGELDVLVSDALLRWAADVRTGRARPTVHSAEVDVAPRTFDVVAAVRALAAVPDVRAALAELPPRNPAYRTLRAVLAQYRQVAAAGGWGTIAANNGLAPGATGAEVQALRRRLVLSGDLPATAATGDLYDDAVKVGVAHFEHRHGLKADGIVSKPVREALNVPVETRIDQLRANLERWRWFPDDLGVRQVRVNVADFTLQLIEHDATTLEMPVIVGKTDWRTPIVSSQIEQLVFNPAWHVPTNIFRKEMIGHARANPAYFDRIGIRVLQRGSAVDARAVDWANTGVGGFALQQPPGPKNPLGRVKFQFPNVNGIYLHDTNNKGAFRTGFRAMSHGCIRVGDALGLAQHLLEQDSTEWASADRRKALTRDWKTRWVALTSPVPVYVTYVTAWADGDGVPHFARDFYDRDTRVLEQLARKNAPVMPPPVAAPAAPATILVPDLTIPSQTTGAPFPSGVIGAPATGG